MTRAIGIDGCRGGWIAVSFDVSNGPAQGSARFFSGFADVLAAFPDGRIAVDMPIGLTTGREGRGCDGAARATLGPRRSSVFTPPCRAALAATDYSQANALNRRHTGKGLSKQAWMIAPKIREIDAVMTPELQRRVVESHPEVAFALASDGPMGHPKARFHGHFERLGCLTALGFAPATLARDLPADIAAAPDDLLDACILAHVAQKHLAGAAQVLPDAPRRDDRGLRMEIWA